MPSRLQIARNDILKTFDAPGPRAYSVAELKAILARERDFWRLAQSTTLSDFTAFLAKSGRLKKWEFPFPYRKEVRYVWGDLPLPQVLMSVKPGCHFSHYTAMQMHDLTEQDPKTIYLNHEQQRGPANGELAQDRIDWAFRRKPRMSNNAIELMDHRICLINGMNTGYLGVEERDWNLQAGGTAGTVRVTDLERTLIDVVVRPFYAGGVGEVLKAYARAAPKVSTNRLAALLKQLGFTYPYHQAIGFYMERSGEYADGILNRFRHKFSSDFDFYLTYQMGKTRYVPQWRLHVPRDL